MAFKTTVDSKLDF